MFAVIYTFKVKQGKDLDFIQGWKGLTNTIYKYEGSRGSRLHKVNDSNYLAYAFWPSREIWENSGANMPKDADRFRNLMRESCEKIDTNFEMDLIEDLLRDEVYKD